VLAARVTTHPGCVTALQAHSALPAPRARALKAIRALWPAAPAEPLLRARRVPRRDHRGTSVRGRSPAVSSTTTWKWC